MDATMKRKLVEARMRHLARTGRYTPDDVLRDAENPKSPLHDQFEWDDAKCGRMYRLEQARELIRSIRIDFRIEQRIVSTVRYVKDPSSGSQQGYIDVVKLRTDKDLARQSLASELKQVTALLQRVRSLADVLGLTADLDEFVAHIQELHGRIAEAA